MGRTLIASASLTLISLLAGARVLALAEFGTLRWLLLLSLAWLLTAGLPTTLAIVTPAGLWRDLQLKQALGLPPPRPSSAARSSSSDP